MPDTKNLLVIKEGLIIYFKKLLKMKTVHATVYIYTELEEFKFLNQIPKSIFKKKNNVCFS
jgi:hypothetical protein